MKVVLTTGSVLTLGEQDGEMVDSSKLLNLNVELTLLFTDATFDFSFSNYFL